MKEIPTPETDAAGTPPPGYNSVESIIVRDLEHRLTVARAALCYIGEALLVIKANHPVAKAIMADVTKATSKALAQTAPKP